MAVAIQPDSKTPESSSSVSTINANLHFSVSEALAESKLLEHVREYRRLSLGVASVNSDLPDQELENRAQNMLQLKQAAEHFNTLISPVDAVHREVLQELKLEQILSKYYWHTLFLANNHPEQGKYELDSLCSKLLNAKYSLSVVGFDIVNSAVEIDADVYAETDEQRLHTTVLPSVSPEILSVVSPNSTTDVTAHESDDLTNAVAHPTTVQPQLQSEPQPQGGAISGLVTGLSALLLLVLAISVFFPDVIQSMQSLVPVGSGGYRLIMLALLFVLTTSFYLMVNKLPYVKTVDDVPRVYTNANDGLTTRWFDIGSSARRIFAAAVAPVLIGLGLGVASSAGLGSFGFALLLEGLSTSLLAPIWFLLPMVSITCWLLAWLFGRVPFGLGTITTLLLMGPAISIGAGFAPENVVFQGEMMAVFLGLFLVAGGISLAAAAALGPDGFTALSLAAERVHHWRLPLSFFLWDLTAICAGVILGGSFGIATAIGLFVVPVLMYFFIPAFRAVLK